MSITQRIDAVTKIPESHLGEIIPPPKSVKIELTAKCNFSCSFCARSMRLRKQNQMDYMLFKRLAQEMRIYGVEELGMFYLGESFLCNYLGSAIGFAKDIGFPYVFLTTNGSLCTPDNLYGVMANGLDSLKFSLNYADANQFHEITKVKKSIFPKIMLAIKTARAIKEDYGFKTKLYASFIQYDGEQAEKMKGVVEEASKYLDEVYALPLYNQASLVEEQERKHGWRPIAGNMGRLGALREPLPCWSAFTEGHITWDGMLSACCFDHNDSFTMANLNDVSFEEGWNSLAFQNLRSAHLKKDVSNTPCKDCVAYR